MYNRLIMMGRLTADPELRTTQNGTTMCRFSIAVDRTARRDEERRTDFFNVVCFSGTAEFVSKYFHKGRMIHLEGALQNNHYTDKNGVKRREETVVADRVCFCGDTRHSEGGNGRPDPEYGAANWQQGQAYCAADRQPLPEQRPYSNPYYGEYPPPQSGNGYQRR